jgi:hypothetical protein
MNDCCNPSPPRIFDEWIRRGTSASPRTHGFSMFAPGRKTEAIVLVTGSRLNAEANYSVN